MRHLLDKGLERIVSRKLLAWAPATGLLAFADLSSADWTMITVVYIGTQGVVDKVARLKGVK